MGAILAPVNNPLCLSRYIACGAEEFYLGFYDPMWFAAFGPYTDLNRMSGFRKEANPTSFVEALGAAQQARSSNCSIYFTFNTAAYSAANIGIIEQYFEQLAWWGASGVILSGPELIDSAKSFGLQTVASTMCGIFNRDIAAFYESCGIDRIILPRDLSLAEIASIVKATPSVEHEVFLMRNGCIFSDSHCLGMHGMSCGALCGEMRAATRRVRSALPMGEVKKNSILHSRDFHRRACGLCALWDFEQLGISAYKIVGRGDDANAIEQDIELVKSELAVATKCSTRDEYLSCMLAHPYADQVCVDGLNCYYPELRYERDTN